MESSDRELRAQLQAQEAEIRRLTSLIDQIRSEVERNRTESADRAKNGRRPQLSEGRDGDMRYVKEGSALFQYVKTGGKWYKKAMDDA